MNYAFIDIFTTQNDLYGKNNCPISFSFELWDENTITSDTELFLNGSCPKKKTIYIVPDEKITIPGFLTSNLTNKILEDYLSKKNPNTFSLKDGLEFIYMILDKFLKSGVVVVGYNHINYDIATLNANFKRVLSKEPIIFSKEQTLDLFELAKNIIPVEKIGNYTMESVYTCFTKDDSIYKRKEIRTTETEISITKFIMVKFMKLLSKDISEIILLTNNEPEFKIFNFGKYKGLDLKTVFDMDKKYLNWILNNNDIKTNRPKMISTIKEMFINPEN